MPDIDFNDPDTREAYFQPTPGRPTDDEIISAVQAMVAFVGPCALPEDPFLSNDICLVVRDAYPNQPVYIGIRTSHLEKAGKLPIRRLGTRNSRVYYSIVI